MALTSADMNGALDSGNRNFFFEMLTEIVMPVSRKTAALMVLIFFMFFIFLRIFHAFLELILQKGGIEGQTKTFFRDVKPHTQIVPDFIVPDRYPKDISWFFLLLDSISCSIIITQLIFPDFCYVLTLI